MNRYNQGFGKFGPMEQCSDGEWVKHEDHLQEMYDYVSDEEREMFARMIEAEGRELDWKFIAGISLVLLVADIIFSFFEIISK